MTRSAILLPLTLILAAPAVLPADSTPDPVAALALTSTFKVEVDGAEVRSARTYAGNPGLLITGCNLKGPVLVTTSDQTVRYIQIENVVLDDEGNANLKGAPSGPICSYQVSAGQIIFLAEGRKVRLSPKDPLVGVPTLDAILEYSPDYGARIEGYKPDTVAVTYLGSYSRKTQIDIYFGTWCSVCEAWVPRLLKALKTAANPAFETRFFALPKNLFSDPAARRMKVQGVPTIILLQDGREVGRMQGRPDRGTIEEALVKMLRTGH